MLVLIHLERVRAVEPLGRLEGEVFHAYWLEAEAREPDLVVAKAHAAVGMSMRRITARYFILF